MTTTRPRLLLFDPYSGGHHAEHIRHIVTAWKNSNRSGYLVAGVSPRLLAEHPDLDTLAFDTGDRGASFLKLDETTEIEQIGRKGLRQIGRINGNIFRRVVEAYKPERAHALFLDHLQFALATSLRFSYPVRISGLLFRPEFHYGHLETSPPTPRERIRRYRKRLLLLASLRNPHLDVVFTLDPTAAPIIDRLSPRVQAIPSPDPVDPGESMEPRMTIRESFGIEKERKMLLLFGMLNARKGVLALLTALQHLSEDACRRVAIVLAGRIDESDRAAIEALAIMASERPLQLILRDEFVPDDRIQSLLSAADLALVPYQRHIGSSGVLIRAAAAGTPVLTQDYGVMAYQASKHRLGQTVDTTSPTCIARAIEAFLGDPTLDFDPQSAKRFAAQNTVEAYTSTFLDALFPANTE